MSPRVLVVFLCGLLFFSCTQPVGAQAPSQYLPAMEAGGGTDFGLALLNSDTADASVMVTARTYDGLTVTGAGIVNPANLIIPASGKLELRPEDIFGSAISGLAGWLEISPSTSAVKAYSFVFDGALTELEGVAVTSTPSSRLIFPKVSAGSGTVLHVVNTSSAPVDSTISLYDNTGVIVASIPVSLPALSGFVRTADDLIQGNPSFDGYAVVQSSGTLFAPQSLAGFETYHNQSDLAAVRGIPAGGALPSGYWPHFASGGGYASRLTLINTTETPQTLQISASTDASGTASVTRTLMPNERMDESVAEVFGFSSQLPAAGSLQFSTQSNVAAFVGVLEYSTADGASLSAAEPQSQAQSDFYFTHLLESEGYYTGVALLNPNPDTSTLMVDLFDKSGTIQASTSLDLAPNQRMAVLIDQLFQEPIDQLGGYVRVSADQPVFAQEILGSANPPGFLANVPADPGTSGSAAALASTNRAPAIASVSPSQALIGGLKSLNLRISGSGFSRGSVVNYDGVAMNTSFIRSTLLAITLSGSHLVSGVHLIQVSNSNGASNVVKILLAKGAYPANQPPVVNAGPDQSITLPAQANLSGAAPDDGLPLNGTLTVKWSEVSGPAAVTFSNAGSTATKVSFSAGGTYTIKMSASDGALSSSDNVVITVAAAAAPAPPTQPPSPPSPPTPPAAGAAYYVSTSGNDSNPGTSQSSPWKTIAKVESFLRNLKPGDSVLFQRGGIWYEELDVNNVNGASGLQITFGNYGSGNLPVIDGGGTPAGTTINGGRQWCIGGSGTKMSYLTIDGFECRYTSAYGIVFVDVSSGSAGIVVQNSYIHDTGNGDTGYHNQLMFAEYNYGHPYGTKFLNNKVGNCYGHNCIQIHGDTGGPLIRGNECYGFAHNCIDVKYSQGALVDSNVVHDGLGIQQYENAFYIENDTAAYTGDVTWIRNIVYGINISSAFQCEFEGGPVTCRVYNNTVYAHSTGVFGGSTSGSVSQVQIYVLNNIFDTPSPRDGGTYAQWDYNDNVQSSKIGPHDLNVNPQYVNAAGHDFHLQTGSPVIDKGASVNLPYAGSAPDLGAFESGLN